MSTPIAKNFTVEEFIRSQTAVRKGINNIPKVGEYTQLVYLATVMQLVRELVDSPISITSGYRSLELNRAIGSKDTSKHVLGRACDFVVHGMTVRQAFEIIRRSHIGYSKMILEFPSSKRGWIHLEIDPFAERPLSKRHLLAERVNGKTQYSTIA